ncbi:hypothetical protein PHJA_002276800 [Phtheirospermum japonicum]|uniref:Selenoprotein H n=1 Tax=Phtheirospermum japonicum TaxID=374723 RepID=A0A830CUM9_9LAMI|nr:hypothetical protein PHJA_002276800 [Phtheirospermum japonicum]
MAPKRKPREANNSVAAAGTRVTRRSARLANATVAPPAADPEPRKRKKAKTTAAAAKEEVETEAESPPSPEEQKPKTVDGSKTIIVEHCKQCNSFKTRAIQVKIGLEKSVGVNVLVNPEKPRRGCFEIREEGGGIFVSLLDMKRPFKPMKDLDMEKVISDIVEKIR